MPSARIGGTRRRHRGQRVGDRALRRHDQTGTGDADGDQRCRHGDDGVEPPFPRWPHRRRSHHSRRHHPGARRRTVTGVRGRPALVMRCDGRRFRRRPARAGTAVTCPTFRCCGQLAAPAHLVPALRARRMRVRMTTAVGVRIATADALVQKTSSGPRKRAARRTQAQTERFGLRRRAGCRRPKRRRRHCCHHTRRR